MKRIITLCALTGALGIVIGYGLSHEELPSTVSKSYAAETTTDVAIIELNGLTESAATCRSRLKNKRISMFTSTPIPAS
jgi:hypothetical protein